jgi:NAD(P)-dependent dehydrogenase (short-subunit alcohol dehydrogenase family)
MKARGFNAVVCESPTAKSDCVIVLDGLSAPTSIEESLQVNKRAFMHACTVAASFEQKGGFFFTAQDSGGRFGGADITETGAWAGGLSGLTKTAAQEWPTAIVRTLDIACGDQSAKTISKRLLTEILEGGLDREIALDIADRRCKIQSQVQSASGGSPCVDKNSVLVVSGGGRGVTAAAMIALAKDASPSFALLGRTVLEEEPICCQRVTDEAGLKKALLMDSRSRGEKITPAQLGKRAYKIQSQREIRETLAQLQGAGSKAAYFPCDVTHKETVAGVCQQVRDQFGAITGIVHGAGVLADKLLSQKTEEQFDRVFNTKVRGLKTLLEVTENDPLTALAFFSSVAARSGNIGQSDYALSNEILNRVADYQFQKRGAQCKVKSIGWGPWESGMVSPALKARFEQMGVPLIPLNIGADIFVQELQQGTLETINIVVGGPPQDKPLAHPAAKMAKRLSVTVDARCQPFLKSHQIQDIAILPMVLVEEWFVRAAASLHSGLFVTKLEKLQVVKGIQLLSYDTEPEQFDIELEPLDGQGTCKVRLFDAEGKIRYTAQLTVSAARPKETAVPSLSGLESVNVSADQLYSTKLFHGPDFAAIKQLEKLGQEGAQATLIGTKTFGWPGESWVTDPALIDGGLQLARIWGFERIDYPTLPTSLERITFYQQGLIEGPVKCIIRGKTMGKAGTRSDLWFVDSNNRLVAEIQGLKMHVALSETSGAVTS